MAPDVKDMTAEEALGPRVPSPVGEVRLMPEDGLEKELNCFNQEVMHHHTDMPTEECAAMTDR